MQKLTEVASPRDLVGRIVLDPELGGRFEVVEAVTEPDGCTVLVLRATDTSDNYVRGEEFDIFLGGSQPAFTDGYLVED